MIYDYILYNHVVFLFSTSRLGMVKPVLPHEISSYLPVDVLRVINSFVPHMPKLIQTPTGSPNLQKELTRIQSKYINGCNSMYLYEMDEFMLDGYCQKTNNSKSTKMSLRKISM